MTLATLEERERLLKSIIALLEEGREEDASVLIQELLALWEEEERQ